MCRYRTLALALPFAALACQGEPTTGLDDPFAAAVTPAPRVFVLNAQLRGIINPEIEPSAATGHVQVKLTENEDGTFATEWRGRIRNPGGETFLRATVGVVGVDPVFTLFRLGGDGVSCGIIDFDSRSSSDEVDLAADIAQAMIINPDIHEARFVSTDRPVGAIVGSFGSNDPQTLVGFNPQPDPPAGQVVRCGV